MSEFVSTVETVFGIDELLDLLLGYCVCEAGAYFVSRRWFAAIERALRRGPRGATVQTHVAAWQAHAAMRCCAVTGDWTAYRFVRRRGVVDPDHFAHFIRDNEFWFGISVPDSPQVEQLYEALLMGGQVELLHRPGNASLRIGEPMSGLTFRVAPRGHRWYGLVANELDENNEPVPWVAPWSAPCDSAIADLVVGESMLRTLARLSDASLARGLDEEFTESPGPGTPYRAPWKDYTEEGEKLYFALSPAVRDPLSVPLSALLPEPDDEPDDSVPLSLDSFESDDPGTPALAEAQEHLKAIEDADEHFARALRDAERDSSGESPGDAPGDTLGDPPGESPGDAPGDTLGDPPGDAPDTLEEAIADGDTREAYRAMLRCGYFDDADLLSWD